MVTHYYLLYTLYFILFPFRFVYFISFSSTFCYPHLSVCPDCVSTKRAMINWSQMCCVHTYLTNKDDSDSTKKEM